MKHILLITLFSLRTFFLLSQTTIDNYKSAADREIQAAFDSSLGGQVRCKELNYVGKYDVETWSPNYDKEKFQIVKPQTISFTYCFFSKPINDTFSFVIKVSNKGNKTMLVSGIKSLPECIKRNVGCKFITKDSAINIAIKDSILYPENLYVTFQQRYNHNDYYWTIIGRPIETKSGPHLHRRSATVFPTRSRKYINALTGQLVTWQTYQK